MDAIKPFPQKIRAIFFGFQKRAKETYPRGGPPLVARATVKEGTRQQC